MKQKLLLLFVGLCCVFPAWALTEFSFTYEGNTVNYEIPYGSTTSCKTKAGTTAVAGSTVSGNLIIPETVEYNGKEYTVTGIGDYSFMGQEELTSVIIPERFTSIAKCAFKGCTSLVTINLSKAYWISEEAFSGCTALKSIVIPAGSSHSVIENRAFKGCTSLESVILPDNISQLREGVFSGCTALKSINLPKGLNEIFRDAFRDCVSLMDVDIPSSVHSIGEDAFANTKNPVYYSYDRRYYLNYVPRDVTSFVIPSDVTDIQRAAFKDCTKLTSITIPETVRVLGDRVFEGCTSLFDVIIQGNKKKIGDDEFKNCSSIKKITWDGRIIKLSPDGHWLSEDETILLHGRNPQDGTPTSIPSTVTTIENYAYYQSFGYLTIPSTVKEIKPLAFASSTIYSINIDGDIDAVKEFFDTYLSTSRNLEIINYGGTTVKSYLGSVLYSEDEKTLLHVSSTSKIIVIPPTIEVIDKGLFDGCDKYTRVLYPDNIDPDILPDNVITVPYSAADVFLYYIHPFLVDNYSWETIYYFDPDAEQNDFFTSLYIAPGAYMDCDKLISLPNMEYVQSIGEYAFKGCSSLAEITLSPQITTIAEGTFEGCSSLASVTLTEGVTSIGEWAFKDCTSLTEIVIPNSVESVANSAFDGCSNLGPVYSENGTKLYYVPKDVKSFIIPAGVETVAEGTFDGCDELTTIYYPDTVDKSTLPANVKAVAYPAGMEVMVGEDGALYSADGKTLIRVPEDAEKFTVPAGVETVAEGAFDGCEKLGAVYSADGKTLYYVPKDVESFIIPGTVETVDKGAFAGCDKLTTIYYPDAVDKSSLPANVKAVAYPAGMEVKIGEDGALYSADGKTLIRVPVDVENFTIPTGVETILPGAFEGCAKLTSIVVPESVTTIGEGAFKGCTSLKTILIGSNVTEIGEGAFEGCENLTTVYYPDSLDKSVFPETAVAVAYPAGTEVKIGEDGALYSADGKTLIRVPVDVENFTIPTGVETIAPGAFEGCDKLTEVTIPEGVKSIGENAFKGCTSLTDLTIPESVESIGSGAFTGCTGLKNITIPETLTEIGEGAFTGCTGLTNVTIPEGVEEIGEGAFEGCTELKEVTVPEGVDKIGKGAFKGCTGLEEVTLPKTLTEIGEGAFEGCEKLTGITIPSEVTGIGKGAFKGCTSLEEVNVGMGVKTIGADAFEGCTSLTEITLHSNVSEIGARAFADCGLKRVNIGSGLKSIGDGAFAGNTGLQAFAITAQTPPAAADNVFDSYSATLMVQSVAAESAYSSSSYCWSKFTTDRLIEATEIYSDIYPSLNLKAGESMQLSVSLLPANVSLPHIFWVSSDPTVATVDHTGKVTMAGGTSVSRATYDADNKCTITAHTLYAGGPTYSFAINDESTGLELMPDDGSALSGDAESDAQVEIYNLNGVRIRSSRADLQPGVYIIVSSGKAERVMVK